MQLMCLKYQAGADSVRDLSVLFLDRFSETWARLNLRSSTATKLLAVVSADEELSILGLCERLNSMGRDQLWLDVLNQVRQRGRSNEYVSVQAILDVIEVTPWSETPDGRVLAQRTDNRARVLCEDLSILTARIEGQTLAAIATRFSVSRERIRQRLKNLELRSKVHVEAVKNRLESTRQKEIAEINEAVQREIRDILAEEPGISRSRLEKASGILWTEIRRNIPTSWLKFILPDEPRQGQGWTEEQVIAALRIASAYEYPLSRGTFDELVAVGEVKCCLSQRVGQIFGKWSTACEAAGIESHPGWKEVYDRFWSDEDCINAICGFLLSDQTSRSVDAYDQWHPSQGNALPSSATLRSYLGGWLPAVQRGLEALSTPAYSQRLRAYFYGEAQ